MLIITMIDNDMSCIEYIDIISIVTIDELIIDKLFKGNNCGTLSMLWCHRCHV